MALILLSLACGSKQQPLAPPPPTPVGVLEPDFSLVDDNPNSATSGQAVSPRQHLGHVSAWYFGHST